MKKIILCVIALMLAGSAFATERHGSASLFGYNHWLPKKAYVAFHYDKAHRLDGFRVVFEAPDGRLFREWTVMDDNGDVYRFPFILEVTLVATKDLGLSYADGWGFGRLDGNNSDVPQAYRDSTFLDSLDSGAKFGIGIMDPARLTPGKLYDFWVALKPTAVNPQTAGAMVRFRLNVDVSALKRMGFSMSQIASEFDLGSEWRFAYVLAGSDTAYNPEKVGNIFSFAIESFKGDKKSAYSDFIANIHMDGAYCKEDAQTAAWRVNGVDECFSAPSAYTGIAHYGAPADSEMVMSTLETVAYYGASGATPVSSVVSTPPLSLAPPTSPLTLMS